MYKFSSESPVIFPQISSACGVTMCSVLHTNTANTWRIKGKIWLLQDPSFSILRDPSTHICVIQPLNIWKPCSNQAALLFFHEKDIMGDGNQHIFSIFPIGSMFCGNQPVRKCTEHEIPCSLEVCVICYLNKQVKKSETTLLVSGEAAFLSSSSLAH